MPSITRRRSPGPGHRPSAEAEILATTRRLLAEGTKFTELGVQQIAAEAGVARSTFYHHFKDKTELLLRLGATMRSASFDAISAWEAADGVDRYAEAFLQVVRLYREHAALVQAIAEVAAYDPTVGEFWREGLTRFSNRTMDVLRQEQRAGRTPADLDLAGAGRVIVMGGERAIVDHVTTGDPADDPAFARELAMTWWYGVFRRPAT